MNTRFLFCLLTLALTPLVSFGASLTTSYFKNVEAITNVSARSAVMGLTGVFTNSLSAAGLATSGTTNATLTGNLLANGAVFTNGLTVGTSGNLFGEAANTISQYNSTAGQSFYVYNTRPDAANYERAGFTWAGNTLLVGNRKAGTGTQRTTYFDGSELRFQSGGTDRWLVTTTGHLTAQSTDAYDITNVRGLSISKTITAGGTTGNQTINKSSGSVNFAAAAQTITVTDSLCTANSVIMATVATDDTTAKSCIATPGAGSFVLKLNAAATAETKVMFLLTN